MQGQMYEVKCEQKNLTQTKALAAEMSAIIILFFFFFLGWDKLFIGRTALLSAGRSSASHMPTHTDQHFDMYVFQRVDGPGLRRRCMALIRLTKMQNNETLAEERASAENGGTAGRFSLRVWMETMLRLSFGFISLKLHEHSAALEGARGGFASRHTCKSLHLLAAAVTGPWRWRTFDSSLPPLCLRICWAIFSAA